MAGVTTATAVRLADAIDVVVRTIAWEKKMGVPWNIATYVGF